MTLHSMYRHQREKLPLSCLHGFVEKKEIKEQKKEKKKRVRNYVNECIEHCISLDSSPSLFPNSNILHQGYQRRIILIPIQSINSLKFFVLFIFVTLSFVIFFFIVIKLNEVKLNNKIPSAMLN